MTCYPVTSSESTGRNVASSEALGSQLRRMREAVGVVGWRAAAAAEMDSAKLSKIENGWLLPTPPQLAALAKYFRVPVGPLEARRLAEEVLKAYAGNPALVEATAIIREEAGEYDANNLSARVSKSAKPVSKQRKSK